MITLSPVVMRAREGRLPTKDLTRDDTCTNVGCDDPITAEVLVGAQRMGKCFQHEREYADRYGPADVFPIRRGYAT